MASKPKEVLTPDEIEDLNRRKYHAVDSNGTKLTGFILCVVENYQQHKGRTTDARDIVYWVNEPYQRVSRMRLPGTDVVVYYCQWWENMCKYHAKRMMESDPNGTMPSADEQLALVAAEIQRYLDAPSENDILLAAIRRLPPVGKAAQQTVKSAS